MDICSDNVFGVIREYTFYRMAKAHMPWPVLRIFQHLSQTFVFFAIFIIILRSKYTLIAATTLLTTYLLESPPCWFTLRLPYHQMHSYSEYVYNCFIVQNQVISFSLSKLLYFLVAPALIYQEEYPQKCKNEH